MNPAPERKSIGLWEHGLLAKSELSRREEAPTLSLAKGLTDTTPKGDRHMAAQPKFVGLDVHQDTIGAGFLARRGPDYAKDCPPVGHSNCPGNNAANGRPRRTSCLGILPG